MRLGQKRSQSQPAAPLPRARLGISWGLRNQPPPEFTGRVQEP